MGMTADFIGARGHCIAEEQARAAVTRQHSVTGAGWRIVVWKIDRVPGQGCGRYRVGILCSCLEVSPFDPIATASGESGPVMTGIDPWRRVKGDNRSGREMPFAFKSALCYPRRSGVVVNRFAVVPLLWQNENFHFIGIFRWQDAGGAYCRRPW